MISSRTLLERIRQVADTLGIEMGGRPRTLAAALETLVTRLPAPSHRASYLLLAVTSARIPLAEEVVSLEREWTLLGPAKALDIVIERARVADRWNFAPKPKVVISSGTILDVHDTANSPFTTGIQRVVRSTVSEWQPEHALEYVAWRDDFSAPRTLTSAERSLATGAAAAGKSQGRTDTVIPFDGSWLLLEIATNTSRTARTSTIAAYSGSHTAAVGHDCIPITSAETAGGGMPGGFAGYLAALAHFDFVASTSSSSTTEFEGWREMLGGAGLAGPRIGKIGLPTSTPSVPHDDAAVIASLGIAETERVVLAVSSHEPRKNHLALLQAAEISWRRGLQFTLVLVGGNSWDTTDFDRALADARARNRRILTLTAASDQIVWALYRRAAFTVFPSLNEGFGLPVVESISAGTPVITSDFGSMKESADGYGGFFVNPRDDEALADALTKLLEDPKLLERLTKQTAKAPKRSWEQYATELWTAFEPGAQAAATKATSQTT